MLARTEFISHLAATHQGAPKGIFSLDTPRHLPFLPGAHPYFLSIVEAAALLHREPT